jgi:hypothetical protein
MKRKINRKMSLHKETLGNLDDANLSGVAGGVLTANTNPCSNCTVCTSCIPTCTTVPCSNNC